MVYKGFVSQWWGVPLQKTKKADLQVSFNNLWPTSAQKALNPACELHKYISGKTMCYKFNAWTI